MPALGQNPGRPDIVPYTGQTDSSDVSRSRNATRQYEKCGLGPFVEVHRKCRQQNSSSRRQVDHDDEERTAAQHLAQQCDIGVRHDADHPPASLISIAAARAEFDAFTGAGAVARSAPLWKSTC